MSYSTHIFGQFLACSAHNKPAFGNCRTQRWFAFGPRLHGFARPLWMLYLRPKAVKNKFKHGHTNFYWYIQIETFKSIILTSVYTQETTDARRIHCRFSGCIQPRSLHFSTPQKYCPPNIFFCADFPTIFFYFHCLGAFFSTRSYHVSHHARPLERMPFWILNLKALGQRFQVLLCAEACQHVCAKYDTAPLKSWKSGQNWAHW